jgi:hypothetical protein
MGAMTKNPFIEKGKKKLTPIERTFVNIFDDPKEKDIPARVVEVTTDMEESNKNYDLAAHAYRHRIGVVVYNSEALEEWTRAKNPAKKKGRDDQSIRDSR